MSKLGINEKNLINSAYDGLMIGGGSLLVCMVFTKLTRRKPIVGTASSALCVVMSTVVSVAVIDWMVGRGYVKDKIYN